MDYTAADNQIIQSETAVARGYLNYYQPVATPEENPSWWWPITTPRQRLTDPSYGGDILDARLRKMAVDAPGIDAILKMTEKWPSLTKILLDERNNE